MAVTKKSLISNSKAPKSTKSGVKSAPISAAKLATASNKITAAALKSSMRYARVTY